MKVARKKSEAQKVEGKRQDEKKNHPQVFTGGTKPAVPYFDTIQDSVAEDNEILPLRHLLGLRCAYPFRLSSASVLSYQFRTLFVSA